MSLKPRVLRLFSRHKLELSKCGAKINLKQRVFDIFDPIFFRKLSVQVNWESVSVLSSTGPSPYTGPVPPSGPPSILDGPLDPELVLSSVLSTAPF